MPPKEKFKVFRQRSIHGWILTIKQPYFCNSYGYPTEKKSSSPPRASFCWNGEGRKLPTPFLTFYFDVHKIYGNVGRGKIALGWWCIHLFFQCIWTRYWHSHINLWQIMPSSAKNLPAKSVFWLCFHHCQFACGLCEIKIRTVHWDFLALKGIICHKLR